MEEENLNNSRFASNLDDYILKNSDGEVISDPVTYLEQRKKEIPTYSEKCSIGDVVVLKITNQQMKITGVDVEINDNFKFDYSGKNIFESGDRTYFFNQRDINTLIQKKHR